MTCKTIFNKCKDDKKHKTALDHHADGFELNEGNFFKLETNANVKAELLVIQTNLKKDWLLFDRNSESSFENAAIFCDIL